MMRVMKELQLLKKDPFDDYLYLTGYAGKIPKKKNLCKQEIPLPEMASVLFDVLKKIMCYLKLFYLICIERRISIE